MPIPVMRQQTNANRSTGRHYIMSVLKMIVSQLILNYNIDLIANEQLANMEWGSVRVPYRTNSLSFARR